MRRTDTVEGLLCRMDSAGVVGGEGATALAIRTLSVSRAE